MTEGDCWGVLREQDKGGKTRTKNEGKAHARKKQIKNKEVFAMEEPKDSTVMPKPIMQRLAMF